MWAFLLAGAVLIDPQHQDSMSVDLSTASTEVNLDRGNKGVRFHPREVNAVGISAEHAGFALSLARDLPELNPGRANGSRAESYGLAKSWDSVSLEVNASRYTGVAFMGKDYAVNGYKEGMKLQAAGAAASFLIWDNGFSLSDVYGLKPSRSKGSGIFAALTLDYLSLADPDGLIEPAQHFDFGDEAQITAIKARAATGIIGSGASSKLYHDKFFVSSVIGYGLGRQEVVDATPEGETKATARFAHKRYFRQALGVCGKQAFAGLLLSSDEPNFDMNGTAVKSSRQAMTLSFGSTF